MINFEHPKVTVLMPVYNCESYIKESLESVLNQTFRNFEILIIDDSSTDGTVSIIKSFKDNRIKLIEKAVNTGYTRSLNIGLKIAKGEYIARMDGDDISLLNRFEEQVNFLEENLDVVLCGTQFEIIGGCKIDVPEKNEEIKLALLESNCIAHPSVMFRKSAIQKHSLWYDSKMEPAEDYDLWVRLIRIGKFHNLQKVLLRYRVHNNQVSQQRSHLQIEAALKSRLKMFQYLNYSIDEKEYDLLKKILTFYSNFNWVEIKQYISLREQLINNNAFFEPTGFRNFFLNLEKQLFKNFFLKRDQYFPAICLYYFTIRNKFVFNLSFKDELKLVIKSLIFFRIR